jgi:meso-butanediol dehydrogenase / (S,S)-butanediol dehydrogenase / diacetyl reductase
MRFTGKTVVVTGAGSGIGARTARRFAAEGANVVVADIDTTAAENVASTIEGAMAVTVDVTSRDQLHDMVEVVTAAFGGIDVLINNAMSWTPGSFLEVTPEEVRQNLTVSLIGPFFASQEVIPGMMERGAGVILNVASVNGIAYYGSEAYSAAKAGLISLTKSVAAEFGRYGIRCNAVAPATIATESWAERVEIDPLVFEKISRYYPLGRIGTPDDVAESLMFLASDAASWITGTTLTVDGGMTSGNVEIARAALPTEASVEAGV